MLCCAACTQGLRLLCLDGCTFFMITVSVDHATL